MTNIDFGSIANDIAQLRGEGASDDDILETYRSIAPRDASDIDTLRGEGASAKDILDTIASIAPARATSKNEDGYIETGRKALQYGSAQAAVGLGRTAHWLGEATGIETAKQVGDTIAEAGRDIAPTDYRPASAEFFRPQEHDRGVGGYGWGYLPRMVLEGAPGLAMDIGAGVVAGPAGFMASNAARGFGPAIDARVENNGGKDASATDYAVAAGSSALQAYLNKLGLNPALAGMTKGAGIGAVAQIPGQIAKASAVDAATGSAGAVIDRAAVTAGTDKGLTIDPHEALGSAASSGATGGAIRTLRGVGDVTNAVRYADMNPAAAQRLATRFERHGTKLDTPEQAFKAVQIAEAALSSEISRVRNDYSTNVGWEGRDRSAGPMDTAEAILGQGGKLSDNQLKGLRDVLSDNPHGQRYLSAIGERSALNDLKSKGRFEDGYFAGGLSSSSLMEDSVNPASWLRSPTKRAIGSTAAILGMGTELEAARALMAPTAAGKILALQGAAYGGVRALDGITGSRNPVREFIGRFGDNGASASSREADTSPMQRALTDAEDLQVQETVRKAAESAVEAQPGALLGKGSSVGSKAANESPRASGERIDPKILRIEVGPYVAERPREGIGNVKAYVAKTRSRMESRADFGSDLEVAAAGHERSVQGLISQLNTKVRSFDEAASLIEDVIDKLPWDKQSAAWDAFTNHEARLRGTY